jgi:hypothetical protein
MSVFGQFVSCSEAGNASPNNCDIQFVLFH